MNFENNPLNPEQEVEPARAEAEQLRETTAEVPTAQAAVSAENEGTGQTVPEAETGMEAAEAESDAAADAAEEPQIDSAAEEPQTDTAAEEAPVSAAETADGETIAETADGEPVAETAEGETIAETASDATLIFTPDAQDGDSLSHDLLDDPSVGDEIGVDENAVLHAGLTHPASAEVDRIIDESKAISESGPQQPYIDPEVRDVFGEKGEGLFDVFDTDAPEKSEEPEVQPEEPEEPVKKRRPGRKKGYGLLGLPHVVATAVWLAIVALIGISLGRMIWVCAAEVLAFGKPDQEYVFTVTDADNIDTIAAKLKNVGLIKYPELFKLYAEFTDAQEDISAGTFTLNSKYDYHALVIAMSYHSPAREYVELIIPEGYTCAQIFALLEKKGVCSAAELEEYAANGEIKDRWFLEGIQRGDKYCLEGYLFPDTYQFYTNDEPGRVLGKFLDNFDARFTDLMKSRLDPLNERLAAILADRGYDAETIEQRKITIREIVIIASMIEKETANDAESYQISSVIYNRLTNPQNYPFLNIDATLIYALDGNIDPETGKTKPLTSEDLAMEHPYNTYTVKGLIPGPISNPGRNSLNAALDPMETDYYFYVYNPNTSTHIFAKTAKEHEKNVNYVRSLTEKD